MASRPDTTAAVPAETFPLRAVSLAYLRDSVRPRVQPEWTAREVKHELVLPTTVADKVGSSASLQLNVVIIFFLTLGG